VSARVGRRRGRDGQHGQGLVEFSFALIIFTMIFIGIIELGRGVFLFNGVSQAAREIARETSVHPGLSAIGSSAESAAMYEIQKAFVPEMAAPVYECVDIAGVLQFDTCIAGDWVRVTTYTVYQPAIPFLAMLGPFTLSSTSSAEIQ
jgi:Flp pilus assembly protein TadG